MNEKEKLSVKPGAIIGRWTVLDEYQKTEKGERKWLCRCECGTERYVLERSLRHGGTLSCGCLRKEAARNAVSHDLTGQVFGALTVLGKAEHQRKNGGIWWQCQCECGAACEYPGTLLVTGRRTRCNSKAHEKNYAYVDISGQRFGRLVAQHSLKRESSDKSVIWHCICDCGNEVDVSYNTLVYSNQQSCGCKKKEHDQRLGTLQTRVDGTSLDIIKSKKIPTDNTTGYKGVYFIRGKYVAKIVFQKKAYYLGTYDNIEDAHEARLDAEESICQPTMEYYDQWQKKAATDPEWAAANPMQIFVNQVDRRLIVSFLPAL